MIAIILYCDHILDSFATFADVLLGLWKVQFVCKDYFMLYV